MVTMTTSLLPFVNSLGVTSPFGVNKLIGVDFARGFFHLIIINSFFGGLIIGKISEGDARYGLKHSAILMTAGYIACALFILPPPVAPPSTAVNITSLSEGSLTGVAGLPMKNIQFRVTDLSGNPMNSTTVKFSILPDGNVTPSSAVSDNDGLVRVDAILGSSPGNYIVIATANGNTSRVNVMARGSEGS